MAGLELEFKSSVTSQQKAWWKEALSRMEFPKDFSTVETKATVATVPDPPCPGHQDYMCTVLSFYVGETRPFEVEWFIREGADDPTQHLGVADDIKSFFMESVVHEYGHYIVNSFMETDEADRANLGAMFKHKSDGRWGTAADWTGQADTEWEDQIKEACAETFKDIFLPKKYRYYDNRTNWWLDKGHFTEFIDLIFDFLCVDETPT
jgi:hypothetical protein